jgi:hypothetical protein
MAQGDLKHLDPDQYTIVLGNHSLSGFGESKKISVTSDTPRFSDKVGVDGEVSRSKSMDRRASVVFTLMQTSASNDVLSGFLALDTAAPNGAGVTNLYIRDRSGRTVYRADRCWVEGSPDADLEATAVEREWTIRCAFLERFDGGN